MCGFDLTQLGILGAYHSMTLAVKMPTLTFHNYCYEAKGLVKKTFTVMQVLCNNSEAYCVC